MYVISSVSKLLHSPLLKLDPLLLVRECKKHFIHATYHFLANLIGLAKLHKTPISKNYLLMHW